MTWTLDLPSVADLEAGDAARVVASIVEALVFVDVAYLRSNRAPSLYTSGVRYEVDDGFRDVPALLARGRGDCKSLAAWRIAELRAAGERATARYVVYEIGDADVMHVLVDTSAGVEDPSARLGMTAILL